MAILNNSNAISSGGYDINNSLRIRSSASAYLSKTYSGSPTSTTKQTFSFWVKRGTLSTTQTLFGGYDGSSGNPFEMNFTSGNVFSFVFGGAAANNVTTTAVYRDPSAWYHIVVAVDTTQATSANRVKIYVNGNQVSDFSASNYPAQNANMQFGLANANNKIGSWYSPSQYVDGYLAEVNFIDGQALTPSSFGETDTTTGSWKPKAYTGTYGTNGFYLKFSDIATTSGSNAGLGKDFSGNANYWATNNISITAGTTYDAMLDVPTNTSATVANYCVMNPLQTSSLATVTDANLTVKGNSASNSAASVASMQVPTGLYYAEFTITGSNSEYPVIGVVNTDTLLSNSSLLLYGNPGYYSGVGYRADGQKIIVSTSAYGSTFTTGDVIGIAVDTTNGAVYFSKNNTWQNSGVPTSGASKTGAAYTYTAGSINLIMSVAPYNTSSGVNANFGQRPFSYTPPTGFNRLNTYNLPDSTIKKGNTVMDATLYTGNGSTQTVTNAAGFKPDFVWLKERSSTSSNNVYDSIRGSTKLLLTNTTDAEQTDATSLTAFNSNGFSLGGAGFTNENAQTYVGWQWQAGQGSTSSNTDGSITSTVSVNTTAGFSVVTYTGNNTLSTIGHGLGVGPKFIIVKTRSGTDGWVCYHASLGVQYYTFLNTTAASYNNLANYWSSTAPSSTTFGINAYGGVNTNAATYVAYCWAEIAGFSKFGSYTGNGSADGPFVYTGFLPKYILIKRTDTTASWVVMDTSRGLYNASYYYLLPNLSDADSGPIAMDFLSNGFKLRLTSAAWNASGGTYIYMAFAESPFKSSLAR